MNLVADTGDALEGTEGRAGAGCCSKTEMADLRQSQDGSGSQIPEGRTCSKSHLKADGFITAAG